MDFPRYMITYMCIKSTFLLMIENKGDARFEQKPQTPKSPDFRHPLTLMWALFHYTL